MRIGLFTDQYYPNISGVVTSVKMLYEGLTAMGHECFIFTSFDDRKVTDPNHELLHKNVINIPGRPVPFKELRDYRYTITHGRFVKFVKKYNLDIIHVQTEYNISKLAIKASKKLNIPIVHTLHTLWSDYLRYVSPFFDKVAHNKMLWLLKVWFTKPVSKYSVFDIVPTKKVYEQAKVYGIGSGLSPEIKVIPTGIELSRFYASNFTKEDTQKLREKIGIRKDQFVFLFIGRMSKEKQADIIIDAYARACKDNNKTVLLMIGGGPDLANLKELAKERGIDNQVVFTGFVEWNSIPAYYQLGDIFVNASQSETQGLTYIEALGSSIPLLVQKDECIADVVEDYYNGIYFDGIDDLVLKMTEILKAPETLRNIKNNTLKSVNDYTKEQFSKNIYAVYEEAIELYNSKNKKK